MKLDDYVRALTAALAALPPRQIALSQTTGVSLTPRAPGVVSVAGKTAAGEVIGLDQWLAQLPAASTRDVRSWSFETLHAPRFAFTAADVVALMDAQTPREAVWTRLFELVRESAEMNGEPTVERSRIRETLLSADDGWWGLMAEQLLEEAEIECLVEGQQFTVPAALEPLFGRSEAVFPDDEWFSVYLYPLGTVTVAQLIRLVEAQGGTERLGPALKAEVAEGFSDFAGQDVSPGLVWLKARTDLEAVDTALSALVCRAICRFCEETRENPVIPPELADSFGPNERDQKRAQLRSKVSGAGMSSTLNPAPWSCYVWTAAGLSVEAVTQSSAASRFRGALVEIEAFARRHESAFSEAFRLALFCLDLESKWDEGAESTVQAQLKTAGFSETALDVLGRRWGPVRDLASLGWPLSRLGAVLALSVADVFGGMGSWNDQDFGDDYEEYSRVSGGLGDGIRTLWQALLEPWGAHGLS